MSDDLAQAVTVPRWQFQLKDVLLVLAGASVLLAPTHYFGSAYLISIAFSLALVLICAIAYRTTSVGAIVIAGLSLIFGFFALFVAIPFAFHTFFNLLACAALATWQLRPKYFAIGLMATLFAVYGFFVFGGMGRVYELKALRLEYPFESLDKRLAFEDRGKAEGAPNLEPIQLAPNVSTELVKQDDDLDRSHWNSRPWDLQELHEHITREFARAAGFGYMRMPGVTAEVVRLKPRRPIHLPAPVALAPLGESNTRLSTLHQSATHNFVDPQRAGYVRTMREVAGFESHGVSSFQREWENGQSDPDWQVTRFELVSLLRHDEPCVYVSASLPEMDKLEGVSTRPLNDFERTALAQLYAQKNVVVSYQPDHVEMLGALRASNNCLKCHAADRGKLLGAFSYKLTPLPASTKSPVTSATN